MPEASVPQPASILVKPNYKACNVTVIADGLQSGVLDPSLFSELGPSKTVLQAGSLGILEFDRRSLIVETEAHRAVATDVTGEMGVSTVAELMERYVNRVPGIQIRAVGFNFFYEFVSDDNVISFVEKFLNKELTNKIGGQLSAAGFKINQQRGPYVRQLALEPVWNNPKSLGVAVNYHMEAPLAPLNFRERFVECATETPTLIEAIIHV